MTVAIANLELSNNTFGDMIDRVDQLSDAASNKFLSTDGTATGNSVLSGTFQATSLFVGDISGGVIGAAAALNFSSNVAFSEKVTLANTQFTGANTHLGLAANVTIQGANSSTYVLAANVSTGKMRFLAPSDIAPTPGSNGHIIINTSDSFGTDARFKFDVDTDRMTVGNNTVNTYITPTAIETDGTITAAGNGSIAGTLGVTGATTLSNTLGVTGATTLSNTLAVTGNVTFSNTLAVTGNADFDGTVTLDDTLRIDGNAPEIRVYESDAGVDEKEWRLHSSAGSLFLSTYSDAGALGQSISLNRTANVFDGMAVPGYGSFTGYLATDSYLIVDRASDSVDASIYIDADAGYYSGVNFRTGSLARWQIYRDNVAEAGSDAGSNLQIARYSDAGAYISGVLTMYRSSGIIDFNYQPTFGNNNLALERSQPDSEVTASRNLAAADAGKVLVVNSGSAVTLTIPQNTMSAHDRIEIIGKGAGTVSIDDGTGVTMYSYDTTTGSRDLAGQYAGASLYFVGANEVYLVGNLA